MAARFGLNLLLMLAQLFTLRFLFMNSNQNYRPIEILLVEDSPSDANLTIREFKKAKIANNLSWVENGEDAMDYLHCQNKFVGVMRPDLILLDLNLPGMDG